MDVFKLARASAKDIYTLSLDLPKTEQFSGLGDQMRRASRGICANIAEGLSKMSTPTEEKRFLKMALGACEEMRVWALLGSDCEFWDKQRADGIRDAYERIAKMLYMLMQKRQS